MLEKIAWIGFIRSSLKYAPSQSKKNSRTGIPEDPGDEREPREVQRHDQQVEGQHPQEQHREQILRRQESIDFRQDRGGLVAEACHIRRRLRPSPRPPL